jgi:hypothetical protein
MIYSDQDNGARTESARPCKEAAFYLQILIADGMLVSHLVILLSINITFIDCFQLYRCFVLYGRSWKIILLPSVLWIGILACLIVQILSFYVRDNFFLATRNAVSYLTLLLPIIMNLVISGEPFAVMLNTQNKHNTSSHGVSSPDHVQGTRRCQTLWEFRLDKEPYPFRRSCCHPNRSGIQRCVHVVHYSCVCLGVRRIPVLCLRAVHQKHISNH